MIKFVGLVGLAESFTGLSGEPPYLVERFELTSFPSGSSLQTKTSPPPRVPLNLNLLFRHRLRGIISILRQIARPRERLPRKSQRLWSYSRVIRYRPCLACLIESPPNQFLRHLSILLRKRVSYSTGVVPTLSWNAGRPGNGLVWAGEARPAP